MISSLELAKLCGVSQGTVDRALHDRPGISAATKQRVLAAAEKHGYHPHPAAAEILKGKSSTIAAAVPKINSVFFMDMLSGIHTGTSAAGFRFIVCPVTDTSEFFDALKEFAARRYAAALVIPPEEKIVVPRQISQNIKIISLLSPCGGEDVAFVSPDEEKTGYDAVEYLYSRGHRKILHFTYARKFHAVAAREAGYRKAMLKNGMEAAVLESSETAGLAAYVWENKSSAVFCHNDWLALQAVRELESTGLRVPQDVSVLGVDNSPTFTELYPGITTMQYPFRWLARTVMSIISETSRGRTAPSFSIIERKTVS